MPIYEYIARDLDHSCSHCKNGFEIFQNISQETLKTCPDCGQAIKKRISSFGIKGSEKDLLSPKNLEKHGFTQYVKKGSGYYEKTAGKEGPQTLHDQ